MKRPEDASSRPPPEHGTAERCNDRREQQREREILQGARNGCGRKDLEELAPVDRITDTDVRVSVEVENLECRRTARNRVDERLRQVQIRKCATCL